MELNKDDFKAWLEANPTMRFFDDGISTSCPIAKWIKSTEGYYSVSVSPINFKYKETVDRPYRASIELPAWAKGYISNTEINSNLTSAKAIENINKPYDLDTNWEPVFF